MSIARTAPRLLRFCMGALYIREVSLVFTRATFVTRFSCAEIDVAYCDIETETRPAMYR